MTRGLFDSEMKEFNHHSAIKIVFQCVFQSDSSEESVTLGASDSTSESESASQSQSASESESATESELQSSCRGGSERGSAGLV